MDEAYDTINHQLLIAKLYAYDFTKNALELILNYLSDRWQRTKINTSFSLSSELLICFTNLLSPVHTILLLTLHLTHVTLI